MRKKFRFEWLLVLFIIISFLLPWISWGKLLYTGFDIPFIYKKTTKISNTVLFFMKKDSVYLAFYIYLVPVLSVLSALFLMKSRIKTSNLFLFLSSLFGFALSMYMYYYLMNSKLFKLSHAGVGLHLLCVVSFIGVFYSAIILCKKKKETDTPIEDSIVIEE